MADSCLTDHRWVAILERFTAERDGRFYTCVLLNPEAEPHQYRYAEVVWFPALGGHDVLRYVGNETEFGTDLSEQPEAIILSPRGYADRTAFGMLICARELLPMQFRSHHLISLAAIVTERTPNTDWVYLREGIDLIEYPS